MQCDYPNEICSDDYECVHKKVFPITPLEFVGIYVLAVLMALSCMAGIGGGGVVVPMTMVFFDLETKKAIAVSGFSILWCSITRYVLNIYKVHPEKEAVCIDYGVSTVMLPTVLIGSLIGVFINVSFPEVILQIMLTLLLIFLAV